MMQTELLPPSWPHNSINFSMNDMGFCGFEPLDIYTNDFPFDPFPSFTTEDSSVSSSNKFFSAENSDDFSALDDLCDWMESSDSELPSLVESVDSLKPDLSPGQSLILPTESTQLDHQLSVSHLVKAYGEAMETEKIELIEAILKRLEERACLAGETVQRLVYYMIQRLDSREGYLMHESVKNYRAGFLAFYHAFPYGKFAHFTANSMILNSLPEEARSFRIFDFDMGEGAQWAPLLESLGRRNYKGELKITSIKWSKEEEPFWSFEKVKMGLLECASYFNVTLEVEEIEMKEIKERSRDKNEWLVFNNMVNLPHMGRVRSDRHIKEFLKIAGDSIYGKRGVITCGDGEWEGMGGNECSDFGSFLEGQLCHLHALVKSMDWYFPYEEVMEARIVMECLFVAPFLSSSTCFKKWEERGIGDGDWKNGLGGLRINGRCVEEAKELVREGESVFWVRMGGCDDNEIVLGFMETPLIRVSCWR